VPHLAHLAEACLRHNAALLVDAYHHLNVVPFDVTALGLRSAYVIGGGYKYCQLGEGNCFLRLPDGCTARPVLTGWFSEFGELAAARTPGEVRYGHGGARFAGSTYDPTAHYRARAVFRFHVSMGLTPARLREINLHQTSTLIAALQSHDLNPAVAAVVEVPADRRAGFIAIRTPQAQRLVTELRTRGVYVDARGTLLRLGPAPYVSDRQLDDAVGQLVAALGG
jgi:kynureninase